MIAAHPLRRIVRAVALLLGGALLAGAHLTASAAPSAATGAFSLTLKAGGFDEICLRIVAGTRIDYQFRAEAEVDFNIHHHRGREVLYPVRQSALRTVEAASFSPTTTEDYCLMWENRGAAPVRVEGRVERGG
jgi:hypothetical protein